MKEHTFLGKPLSNFDTKLGIFSFPILLNIELYLHFLNLLLTITIIPKISKSTVILIQELVGIRNYAM